MDELNVTVRYTTVEREDGSRFPFWRVTVADIEDATGQDLDVLLAAASARITERIGPVEPNGSREQATAAGQAAAAELLS